MSNNTFYGDNTRWFIGKVISINDPLELGRVKVRIFGIHSDNTEDIPESDLPWAQTIIPVTEGGSSGLGANVGIKEQSQVFGMFLDGKNSQLPIVMGSIPKYESRDVVKRPQVSIANLTGQTNIEKAYNWFLTKEGGDFTPEQSCGIIGNLLQESGTQGDLNPIAKNPTEGSFGIAQWNPARAAGNRYGALLEFSRENGYNYQSLEAQLAFITHELFTTEKRALQKVRDSKTVEDATLAFEWYERPAGWTLTTPSKSATLRIAYAEDTFEKMEIV